MASTEQLIDQLSYGIKPVKFLPVPLSLFIKWLGSSSFYLLLLLAIFNVRSDITVKIYSVPFVFEIVMLSLVVITSALSAIFLSFPDMFQKRLLVLAPILAVVLFIITLLIECMVNAQPESEQTHGITCLLCITMFSIIPAFLMFRIIQGQATTHYYTSGMVSLLAASSIGAITLRLSENTDSMLHLIEWHYIPMFGLGLLGLWLGKKIFRW